jgi:hypothetical protein
MQSNRGMAEHGTHLVAVNRGTPATQNTIKEVRKRNVEVTEACIYDLSSSITGQFELSCTPPNADM